VGPVSGAAWAWRASSGGRRHRPDARGGGRHPPQSRLAPADRDGVESGRCRQDGVAAMSLPVPVLRRQGPAVVPALSALGRRLPRRAFQHRLLRVVDPDGGAGDRAQTRRVRAHAWRRASLLQSRGGGGAAVFAPPAPAAGDDAQPRRARSLCLPLRGFLARWLRAVPAHQGQGCGVSEPRAQSRIEIVLVAAVADNGVIGRGDALPWRLKSDMQHLRAVTWGKPVVVGRTTFLSFSRKPLPGRTNIVLSGSESFAAPGALVASRLDAALEAARGDAL